MCWDISREDSNGINYSFVLSSNTVILSHCGKKNIYCFCILLYIELTISFLIGQKRTVNFQNQHLLRHLAADYTKVMSRTLKVMGNHVMYDSGVWFLTVIMSSSHALCCLSSVKKQKNYFHLFFVQCRIKQLDSVLMRSRIIKFSVRVIRLPWLFWIARKLYPIIIIDKLIKMVNFKLGNKMWRWINQHDTSVGQRKILSPRQESNPWLPEHRAGALSAELRELMASKVI